MKFKFLVFFFFIISCSPYNISSDTRIPYNTTGFAYIYNVNDFTNKLVGKKLDNSIMKISHRDLKAGSLIKIINPKTNNSLVLKNSNKIKFPEFYKILLTKSVAKKLNLEKDLPLVEILEIKKNKSFVAEKAIIYKEEKEISSKAPVTSVKIANISKKKKNNKKINSSNIYILIASFYSKEAANLLKKRIINETPRYDINKIKIQKKNSKEFEVLSGPYKSVNLLKNDYIELKIFGFEELDIFINE